MGSSLEITHSDPSLIMAMHGPVCVALWRKKPTRELVEIQASQLARAVERAPGKVAFMCVVSPTAEPPDDAERSASAKMISVHGSKLSAVACVIEGSGFRAAITRTVLSGIVFIIRTPSPIRLFESVELAVPWLSGVLGQAPLVALPTDVASVRGLSAA